MVERIYRDVELSGLVDLSRSFYYLEWPLRLLLQSDPCLQLLSVKCFSPMQQCIFILIFIDGDLSCRRVELSTAKLQRRFDALHANFSFSRGLAISDAFLSLHADLL